MPSNNLFYYMKQVQRRCGLTVSLAFPNTIQEEQQLVLDGINNCLRYLNNKYAFAFQQSEYTLTTTAGVKTYSLAEAPHSLPYWRLERLAKHGVVRLSDDWPLRYLQYDQLDSLQPSSASNGEPEYYSAYAGRLVIHPPPDGSQLKIRYHSTAIGTDATGVTQKLKLSEETDLPMLEDEWEDVLVTGAAMRVQESFKVDEKWKALAATFEHLETQLNDLANQPGEDAAPQLINQPYVFNEYGFNREKYYPFFTRFEG